MQHSRLLFLPKWLQLFRSLAQTYIVACLPIFPLMPAYPKAPVFSSALPPLSLVPLMHTSPPHHWGVPPAHPGILDLHLALTQPDPT